MEEGGPQGRGTGESEGLEPAGGSAPFSKKAALSGQRGAIPISREMSFSQKPGDFIRFFHSPETLAPEIAPFHLC